MQKPRFSLSASALRHIKIHMLISKGIQKQKRERKGFYINIFCSLFSSYIHVHIIATRLL
ncbi:unnamed protein product [Meloidogyne enterolobii]|uniref:Uncharacterized protein n=1 Tax=Meloidogyne enterolobii TaxID=390850 RepID=A0ACB0Y4B4_MELEN